MDRRAWWARIHEVSCTESDMTEHICITIIMSNTQLLSWNFLCLHVLKFLFSGSYISFGSLSVVWRTSSSSFPKKDIWLIKFLNVCVCVLSHVQLFATPWTVAWLLCLWNFPVKNTGGGCHFLPQGMFLTQKLNPHLSLLHWQVDYLFIYFNHWATLKVGDIWK